MKSSKCQDSLLKRFQLWDRAMTSAELAQEWQQAADLPKPSISRNPTGDVSWGQNLGITCSISTQHLGGTFILKKTSGSFRMTQSSSTDSVTFNIPNVNFDNEGSYQCQYEKSISSRSFSSPLSDSVTLSVTVSLPKPSISMNPTGEVAWGEKVGITCSISTQHVGGTFILKKTSGSFRMTQSSTTNSATFNIPNVNFDNEGSYQCQYEKSISSRSFSSPLSDSVRLSVTVSLPRPSISMNPTGEVAWGEKVGITCLISTQYLGGTFILKKTSGSFRMTLSSSTNSASFNIPNVNFDNEGSYQCQYEKSISSRSFSSPLSDSVRLSVAVPLQQPSISLTSPNRGLVWGPEGAVVTRGNSFVLTCSINSSYSGGYFSLIFSGSNITNTEPAVNLSASFNFPVAEYEHEGNYSCVYEVTLSGRKFSSTMTSVMNVAIKFPLLLMVSSASTGTLLLLLLVLLVVCLVNWRRRRAKQPIALSLSPVAISNEYQVTDEDENEEEQHYMNFQPLHSEKRQKEQAREMEMEEDESDNVYDVEEDNEGHYSVEREDIYVIVDDNEEEYDICVFNKAAKDNSDTDDAHQHIPSAEDTLDIYGEQEDVYQNF
ncbi:uncharacterized protein LOC121883855 [Scomber scombrus]|uniref:Uncharacterized protein LOC121883855 n=1 Tax=Scomber scombrus TaxID=13677 RepID=A0AAV1NKW0_SCOSC